MDLKRNAAGLQYYVDFWGKELSSSGFNKSGNSFTSPKLKTKAKIIFVKKFPFPVNVVYTGSNAFVNSLFKLNFEEIFLIAFPKTSNFP